MPTPCDWNANNLACTNTWGVLLALEELKAKFSQAGGIRMDALAYWNKATTPDLREIEAAALAARMDRLFRKLLQAKFEPGSDLATALAAMKAALLKASGTVCELSLVVDEHYNFQGEIK